MAIKAKRDSDPNSSGSSNDAITSTEAGFRSLLMFRVNSGIFTIFLSGLIKRKSEELTL